MRYVPSIATVHASGATPLAPEAPWTPESIGPSAWYTADPATQGDNGSEVVWNNKGTLQSAQPIYFQKTIGTKAPTFEPSGVVSFDGVDDVLTLASAGGLAALQASPLVAAFALEFVSFASGTIRPLEWSGGDNWRFEIASAGATGTLRARYDTVGETTRTLAGPSVAHGDTVYAIFLAGASGGAFHYSINGGAWDSMTHGDVMRAGGWGADLSLENAVMRVSEVIAIPQSIGPHLDALKAYLLANGPGDAP